VWNSGDRDVKVVAEIPDSHSEESTGE
jgi:hypothetical protein